MADLGILGRIYRAKRSDVGIFSGGSSSIVAVLSGGSEEVCTGACVFVSSWTGTDILNSGTSYVWDAEEDTAGLLSHGTTAGTGWNGQDNYLHYSGSSSAIARVYENVTATSTIGIRLAVNLVSESLANDGQQEFLRAIKVGGASHFMMTFYQTGGVLYIRGQVQNSLGATISVGTVAISTGTWYQVQIKWQKATANAFSFEVWNEAGTAQVGSTCTLDGYTTYNSDVDRVSVGKTSSTTTQVEHNIDIVKITNTYDFPGIITP